MKSGGARRYAAGAARPVPGWTASQRGPETEGRLRLGLLSADGAEVQILADSIEVEGAASWSPDGKWIVTGGNDGTGQGYSKFRWTAARRCALPKVRRRIRSGRRTDV